MAAKALCCLRKMNWILQQKAFPQHLLLMLVFVHANLLQTRENLKRICLLISSCANKLFFIVDVHFFPVFSAADHTETQKIQRSFILMLYNLKVVLLFFCYQPMNRWHHGCVALPSSAYRYAATVSCLQLIHFFKTLKG